MPASRLPSARSPYKTSSRFRRVTSLGATLVAALWTSAYVHAAVPADWWVSVTNDRPQYIQQSLAKGVDPNAKTPDGQPAVMQAIRDGSWKVYDVLVAHPKFDPNVENKFGETPLMYLAVLGEAQRGQALIKKGAQVNRLGWTPLQYAASKGQLEMAKMLLANQAIVNAPGPEGTTALMMAALSGNQQMVQLLLDAGADVTMQTTQKETAAAWARKRDYESLARKLDDLDQKVLAQRKQMRSIPGQAVPEPAMVLPPEDPAQDTQKSNSAAASSNGTSRYFDLKRFD